MDAGAESIAAPEDKPYGERGCGFRAFGNTWWVATYQCTVWQIPSPLRCAFSPLAALRLLTWGLPLFVGRALPATKIRYRKAQSYLRDSTLG